MHLVRTHPAMRDAVAIAAEGFARPVTPELEQDVASHLADGQLVYSFVADGATAGFVIFDVIGEAGDILYLSGIILRRGYQRRRNVLAAIQAAQQALPRVRYLAYRTQSLRMYTAGMAACEPAYPNRENGPCGSELLRVGQQAATHLGGVFPVTRGCYGGPLYGERPQHPDAELSAWWDGLCSFADGDAVIVVGALLPPA
ncbi:hypothetical protein JNJ66_00140 [Candidatus Saccharibacteria bacterium]|nr:hypothetical protein [Candidatus Saccharibacteria bacterium]